MSDSLKDFIKKNREAFDQREPSEKVWSAIDQSLPEMKQKSLWNSVVVWRVAALLFMGLSLYLFIAKPNSAVRKPEVAQMQKDFSDQEMFYSDQIAEKVAFIDDLDGAFGDDQFTQDFQKLDAMYQVLREEMKAKPTEKVRDALILNMLVRIDLFNQQIKRLEDAKDKTRNEESSI
ncbi:MAG TPA: hypothetical protein VIT44_14065 [Cyclobacteriaceae bacterium]